jgi:hypothetical protein
MHDHDHPRDGFSGHQHESAAGRPHDQHVVLELGEGMGALIVRTDPELLGTEVEISPAADDAARSHKEVLERITGAGPSHVLVFDNLAEGGYTLWIENVPQTRNVHVVGGAVAELDWRGKGVPPRAAQQRRSPSPAASPQPETHTGAAR